jgi:inhibitor of nuclear factor kappa-B kinase subunit alpha
MDSIDLKTRILLVRLYYENGSSAAAALRKFKTLHGLIHDPFSVTSVQRLMHKFEHDGVVTDLPKSGRPSFGDDVVENVKKAMEEGQASSHLSIFSGRAVSRVTGIPSTTVWRALKWRLHLHPYHVRLTHELKEKDFEERVAFANWFLERMDDDGFSERVLWTDEAHFHLDGSLTHSNCVIWSKEDPCVSVTKSLHPQRVTVWCGFSAKFILPPAFLEKEETITAQRYLNILQNHMLPKLPRRQNVIFMQDGAAPHVANVVKGFLREKFGDNVISRHFPNPWPARSPDLNPCDFFLWGHLKYRVFLHNPKSLSELKTAIEHEINHIDRATLTRTVDSLFDRLLCVISTGGRHIE